MGDHALNYMVGVAQAARHPRSLTTMRVLFLSSIIPVDVFVSEVEKRLKLQILLLAESYGLIIYGKPRAF